MLRKILVVGAGKSTSYLLDYLLDDFVDDFDHEPVRAGAAQGSVVAEDFRHHLGGFGDDSDPRDEHLVVREQLVLREMGQGGWVYVFLVGLEGV